MPGASEQPRPGMSYQRISVTPHHEERKAEEANERAMNVSTCRQRCVSTIAAT